MQVGRSVGHEHPEGGGPPDGRPPGFLGAAASWGLFALVVYGLGHQVARAWTGLVRAVVGEDVKVGVVDAWWSGDSGVTCDDLDGSTWPWSEADLLAVYTDTGFTEGLWALSDAPATVDALTDVGANVWVAWVPENMKSEWAADGCAWGSLAAVDHVIDRRRSVGADPTVETMVRSLPGSAEVISTFRPCQARWLAERLRLEADEHDDRGPGVVLGILMDESWRVLDAPDGALWESVTSCDGDTAAVAGAHWTPDDFDALAEMFRSGAYTGESTDGSPCASDPASPPSGCDTGAAVLDGSDVQFWAMMLDAAMPRHVVPSVVLGVPAHLDDDSSACGEAYSFCSGESAWAEWTSSGPLLNSWPTWARRVVLDVFYVVGSNNPPLELAVSVNGTPVVAHVYEDATDTWPVVSDSLSRASVFEIGQRRYCIGGPECTGAAPWVDGLSATNTIELRVSPSDASTVHKSDRLVYAWGVRVRYYGIAQDPVWEDELTPSEATLGFDGDAGDAGVGLADTNAAWRVTDSLDGVVINKSDAPGITDDVEDAGRSSKNVMYFGHRAYVDFVEHACDWLDARGVTCIVNVPGASNASPEFRIYDGPEVNGTVYPRAPLEVWRTRLDAGDYPGGGVASTWFPLEFATVGTGTGRWLWRSTAPCPSSGCVMGDGDKARLFEIPNTRIYAGTRDEYDVTLATDTAGSCDGTFQVDVDVVAPSTNPVLHWWVVRNRAGSMAPVHHERIEKPDTGTEYHRIVDVGAIGGDSIRLYWKSLGGGMSPGATTTVEFTVTPPDPACDMTWSHTTAVDTGFNYLDTGSSTPTYATHVFATSPMAMYECIVDWWAGDGGACR